MRMLYCILVLTAMVSTEPPLGVDPHFTGRVLTPLALNEPGVRDRLGHYTAPVELYT